MRNVIMFVNIFIVSVMATASNSPKTSSVNEKNRDTVPVIVSDKMRFTESTYPYNGGFIVGNFGSSELNPLNKEGKGYLLFLKDITVTVIIPADGNLNAPRGMYEKAGRLYIADVNKILVYNLNALKEKPQTIQFAPEDIFVNDLAAQDDTLFATVSNTGKIFTIDIKIHLTEEQCKYESFDYIDNISDGTRIRLEVIKWNDDLSDEDKINLCKEFYTDFNRLPQRSEVYKDFKIGSFIDGLKHGTNSQLKSQVEEIFHQKIKADKKTVKISDEDKLNLCKEFFKAYQ